MADPTRDGESRFPTTANDLKTLAAQVTLETKRDIRQAGDDHNRVQAVDAVFRRYDNLIQLSHNSLPEGTAVACKAGCAYCCKYTRHHCTSLEAKAIVIWLKANVEDAKWPELEAKIRAYATALKTADTVYGLPCVFLSKEDTCTIYPTRPIVCRGQNSLSREACRRGYELHNQEVDIPILYADQQLGFAFLKGLAQNAEEAPVSDMAAMIVAELDKSAT